MALTQKSHSVGQRRETQLCRCAQLAQQILADGFQIGLRQDERRFGAKLDGTKFQCAENAFSGCVARDNNDGPGLFGHEQTQKRETVEFRHLQIERDHVGVFEMNDLETFFSILCLTDDL